MKEAYREYSDMGETPSAGFHRAISKWVPSALITVRSSVLPTEPTVMQCRRIQCGDRQGERRQARCHCHLVGSKSDMRRRGTEDSVDVGRAQGRRVLQDAFERRNTTHDQVRCSEHSNIHLCPRRMGHDNTGGKFGNAAGRSEIKDVLI